MDMNKSMIKIFYEFTLSGYVNLHMQEKNNNVLQVYIDNNLCYSTICARVKHKYLERNVADNCGCPKKAQVCISNKRSFTNSEHPSPSH